MSGPSAPRDLTILVNTSDGFEDCWRPFFQLFQRYWPGCDLPIVLNTETKPYTVDGLDLRAAQTALGDTCRPTWSTCLARCLDAINTPYVLYLQEDYFLEAPVRQDVIAVFMNELRAGRADVIRLMECSGAGPWRATAHPLLWEVTQQAAYRIALQAALWRKSTLRGHLRGHESPWQLEVFGSARARRQRDTVLCVNRDVFQGLDADVFPYRPTGVVSGRWDRSIVDPLFARHGIAIDFSLRGDWTPGPQAGRRRPVLRRIADRLRSLR